MEMKEYKAPKVEIVKLKNHISLLTESMNQGGSGDSTDPSAPIEI